MNINTLDFIRSVSIGGILAITYTIIVNGDDAGVLAIPMLCCLAGVIVPTIIDVIHDAEDFIGEDDR